MLMLLFLNQEPNRTVPPNTEVFLRSLKADHRKGYWNLKTKLEVTTSF